MFAHVREMAMTQSAHKETVHAAGREAALRMYPNNSLKKVTGEFRDLGIELVRETFQK